MLHVLTVHWRYEGWIDIQLRYLRASVKGPVRTYAALSGVDAEHRARFDVVVEAELEHADNLNRLAALAGEDAGDDDLLVFLDGDAFPVAPLEPWIAELLSSHPLAAVRRDENLGDPQPHPCFCVTTSGFWKKIQGDWRPGHQWRNARGDTVTDVGGNLLAILAERGIAWKPIRRTASCADHDLWYGIYGGHLYHHGAGFRPRTSRLDVAALPAPDGATAASAGDSLRTLMALHLEARAGERIRQRLASDPDFFRRVKPSSREGGGTV